MCQISRLGQHLPSLQLLFSWLTFRNSALLRKRRKKKEVVFFGLGKTETVWTVCSNAHFFKWSQLRRIEWSIRNCFDKGIKTIKTHSSRADRDRLNRYEKVVAWSLPPHFPLDMYRGISLYFGQEMPRQGVSPIFRDWQQPETIEDLQWFTKLITLSL